MSIREKVARAICQAGCTIKNCPCHYADGDQEIKEATAAITAFLEATAEQGWRMVPNEATEEMLNSRPQVKNRIGIERDKYNALKYCALMAAAPKFEWDK